MEPQQCNTSAAPVRKVAKARKQQERCNNPRLLDMARKKTVLTTEAGL